MFRHCINKSQFLFKRLVVLSNNSLKTHVTFPVMLPNFKSSKASMYSFSSVQQQTLNNQNNYKEDLVLLGDLSQQELAQAAETLEKYTQCKDSSLLAPHEAEDTAFVLFQLAQAHQARENHPQALRYIKEAEDVCQKAGMKDTIRLAYCYLVHAKLVKENLTEAEHYLNEVDRICQLFKEDKEAKSLRLQAWDALAHVYFKQNKHDKALETCNSILERTDDIHEMVLKSVLVGVYHTMASVYQERRDVDQAFKFWTKALENAIEFFGEGSPEAFDLVSKTTLLLNKQAPTHPKCLQYVEKQVKIALKAFPKDSPEVATSYNQLASYHDYHKNYIEASISYEEAVKIFEKLPKENKEKLEKIYFHLVRVHNTLGDIQKAKSFLERADQLFEKYANSRESVAEKYLQRSRMLSMINMQQECAPYELKALEIYKSIEPQNTGKLQEIYRTFGINAFRNKDYTKAYELFKESEKYIPSPETDLQGFGFLYTHLGVICMHLERFDEAEQYIIKVLQVSNGKGSVVDAAVNYHNLAFLYEQKGHQKEAMELKKQALEIEKLLEQYPLGFLPEGLKYKS